MLRRNKNSYTNWSDWSKCTNKCETQRLRKCKYETLCGHKQIKSEAYCYYKGTKCEKKFKKGELRYLYESNPDSNDIMSNSDKKSQTKKQKKQSSKKNQCGKSPFGSPLAPKALRIIGKLSVISFTIRSTQS